MTEQELADMRSAALRNVDNLQLTGEPWGTFDPTSILKLLDYVQETRADKANLRAALEDIASGEIMRSHCTGPHCVEARCVATADEMASRAAGALEWDGFSDAAPSYKKDTVE